MIIKNGGVWMPSAVYVQFNTHMESKRGCQISVIMAQTYSGSKIQKWETLSNQVENTLKYLSLLLRMLLLLQVTVADRTLGSWFRIPLQAWLFILVFFVSCYVVLRTWRPQDSLITPPGSYVMYLHWFIILEVGLILNWNRPQSLIRRSY